MCIWTGPHIESTSFCALWLEFERHCPLRHCPHSAWLREPFPHGCLSSFPGLSPLLSTLSKLLSNFLVPHTAPWTYSISSAFVRPPSTPYHCVMKLLHHLSSSQAELSTSCCILDLSLSLSFIYRDYYYSMLCKLNHNRKNSKMSWDQLLPTVPFCAV